VDAVTISKITEAQVPDGAGKAQTVVRVQFMVGSHGPFVEQFPKATFDPASALAQVTAFAQKLGLLTSS